MNYNDEYLKWLEIDDMDAELKCELESMGEEDKKEAFSKYLEFGTAGLRGILGAGTNKMNKYVVGLATQGLAEIIKEAKGEEKGVVIAYDSRKYSDAFARESAAVLAANGIKVFLFESLRPVPELSFSVRHLKAIAGIVITASHNPACYNGYKVYWSDGCQLPPPEAKKVFDTMLKTDIFSVKRDAGSSLINIIGKEVDEEYYKAVLGLSLADENVKKEASSLKVVYTPLHGSGNIPVREVLKRAGFDSVTVVKEQEMPDPAFSTVKSPNPEDKEGFEIAFSYADDADIIIGTDPDCDRVGVVLPDKKGGFVALSGNQIGVLLCEYILANLEENNKLPKDGAVIRSIVSTKMVEPICEKYGVSLVDVLTGFKYIGGKIDEFDEKKTNTFLFGFEESCGYLSGKHARDKDGVNASLLVCEMAAFYKAKGLTVFEHLNELYKEFGYYNEKVISIVYPGLSGMEKIKGIMTSLRENHLKEIAGVKVTSVSDFKEGIKGLPAADVLRFDLADETTVFIRPSGTEPKIKAYIMTKADSMEKAKELAEGYDKEIRAIME